MFVIMDIIMDQPKEFYETPSVRVIGWAWEGVICASEKDGSLEDYTPKPGESW